jgi:glycosyltransferase involved in cell wall biosynthesis
LIVSELVSYKRIADAVRCFSKIKRPLKMVGQGPKYLFLKSMAASNIEFCGRVSDYELRDLYARCRAVILPGEEDFGIVPVEAMASGKPVIALGRGGVLESVPEDNPRAGFFYPDACEESLAAAVKTFESRESSLSPAAIRRVASRFSQSRFQREMSALIFGPDEISEDEVVSRSTAYGVES